MVAKEKGAAAAVIAKEKAATACAGAKNITRSLSFTRRRPSSAAARHDGGGGGGSDGGQPEIKVTSSSSGASGLMRSLSFGRRSSVNADLPRGWKRMTDGEGNEYFFNIVTKETSQDRPKPLPRYWREALDKSTGQVYYWNMRTRAVRWERPAEEGAEPGAAAAATGAAAATAAAAVIAWGPAELLQGLQGGAKVATRRHGRRHPLHRGRAALTVRIAALRGRARTVGRRTAPRLRLTLWRRRTPGAVATRPVVGVAAIAVRAAEVIAHRARTAGLRPLPITAALLRRRRCRTAAVPAPSPILR